MTNEILMSPIMLSLMAAFVAVIILYMWMKYTSSSDDDAVMNKNIYIAVFFITAGVVFGVLQIISNLSPDISTGSIAAKSSTLSPPPPVLNTINPRMEQGTNIDFGMPDNYTMELETGIPKF